MNQFVELTPYVGLLGLLCAFVVFAVVGRRSPRFYRFATRWMVNEVAVHRMRNGAAAGGWRLARSYLNARLGRVGMLLTRREVDRGLPA